MKKNTPIYFLTVLAMASILVVAGILVYPRGGGNGLGSESDWSPKLEFASIQKPEAIPQVCTDDQALDPLRDVSQSIQKKTTTCTVDFPNLQVNTYCLNKVNKLGGATIVIPEGTSEYINLPKNCSIVLNEESLHANKIACYGPAGSKVNLTLQNSCKPPDSNLPEVVEGSCPPGYILNPNGAGGCQHEFTNNNFLCPTGYMFDSTSNCCRTDKAFASLSACPDGYLTFVTWEPGLEEHTYEQHVSCVRKSSLDDTRTTRNYNIVLGSCDVSDQNNDKKQVPCTLDPATGACQ